MRNVLVVVFLFLLTIRLHPQNRAKYCESVAIRNIPSSFRMVDAMNYMARDGWDFINSYQIIKDNETYQFRWT